MHHDDHPYVNARPHLGFALEIVQADVPARHHRRRGEPVREPAPGRPLPRPVPLFPRLA